VYVNKLEELRAIGEPIVGREREESERPGAIAALTALAENFLSLAGDEAHAHIDAADLEKVAQECNDALAWLNEKATLQAATPKTQPAVLLISDIDKKRATLERVATPILSRPKPAPKVETPPPAAEDAEPMDDGTAEEGAEEGEEANDEAMDDAADSLD